MPNWLLAFIPEPGRSYGIDTALPLSLSDWPYRAVCPSTLHASRAPAPGGGGPGTRRPICSVHHAVRAGKATGSLLPSGRADEMRLPYLCSDTLALSTRLSFDM